MSLNRRQFSTAAFCFALGACSSGSTSSKGAGSARDDDVVAPGAKLRREAGGFRFTEGPAADRSGNVYFTDLSRSRIHRFSVSGKLSTFRANSGGANGLYFDKRGNLVVCEARARRVTSISQSGRVTVLADRFNGKRLNSPNDLWVDPRGGVYFTDPRVGNLSGVEQDGFHVYYISPDRRTIQRVIDNLDTPNGVVGTADGARLYVVDAGRSKTYTYRINPDGSLGKRRLVTSKGSDGMTLDVRGNLYITSGDVLVYNTRNRRIASLNVPETPSNLTFGGADNQTLFITAQTGLYSLRMSVRGQS